MNTTQGFYNPFTIQIHDGGTAYGRAHEYAHLDQHARRTPFWVAWEATRNVPLLYTFTLFLVEAEATAAALLELHRCRILCRGDVAEAAAGLLTYARALTWL